MLFSNLGNNGGDFWQKANKLRQIAVSQPVLNALRRYRRHLGYSVLPAPDEQSPLIEKEKGTGPIKDTRVIRNIVQECFDAAVEQLRKEE